MIRMRLHHVGKVVADLDAALRYHRETFGLEPTGEIVLDPIQKVRVVKLGTGGAVTLELICPTGGESPVHAFLKKGGGLHHLSFAVPDIAAAIETLRNRGALLLGGVVPSAGYGGVPSAWLYTAGRELVELMEMKEESD
jgi:methylmalonyl-CoA/ethylmalonyl-CoA epimerase